MVASKKRINMKKSAAQYESGALAPAIADWDTPEHVYVSESCSAFLAQRLDSTYYGSDDSTYYSSSQDTDSRSGSTTPPCDTSGCFIGSLADVEPARLNVKSSDPAYVHLPPGLSARVDIALAEVLPQESQQHDSYLEQPAMDALPSPFLFPPPAPGIVWGVDGALPGAEGCAQWPSLGSVGHPKNCAMGCKYHGKARGCKDGFLCGCCHLCAWRKYDRKRTRQVDPLVLATLASMAEATDACIPEVF